MHNIFIQKNQKHEIPYVVSGIILLLFSIAITFFVFYLQFYSTEPIEYGFSEAGFTIFMLNFLPVLLFTLLVYFISGRISVAMFLSAFLFCVMALVNRFKIIFRLDPFVPSDLQLFTEVMSIAPTLGNSNIILFSVCILALIIVGIVTIKFIKNKKVIWQVRVIGGVLTLIIWIVLNITIYSNTDLYSSLPVFGNPYFTVANYNTKGFTYSFIYQFNSNKTVKPNGYNKNLVQAAISDHSPNIPDNEIKPHIIMVMGEAFSDISESPALSFKNHQDPLENFKILKKQGISGHMLVSGLGGGTTDTEFDVLTGMSKREIDSVTYAYRLINGPTPNMASHLADIGYQNIFIHPGDSWFYNRINVYEYLGFTDLHFNEFFKDARLKGNYINEESTIDAIIEIFEDKHTQNPNDPIFEFCVTIQNHGAYEEKYLDWHKNFEIDKDLDPSDVSVLSNYFLGLIDQDTQLMRLAEYLDNLDEPAVLIYFGDHMPSIPLDLFQSLDIPFDFGGDFEERSSIYKIPYLIWQNECYKNLTPFNERNTSLEHEFISSNYLGAYFLELMGYGELSEFISFLNSIRNDIPVMAKYEFITKDGYKSLDQLSEYETEQVQLYKYWQHYMLHEK